MTSSPCSRPSSGSPTSSSCKDLGVSPRTITRARQRGTIVVRAARRGAADGSARHVRVQGDGTAAPRRAAVVPERSDGRRAPRAPPDAPLDRRDHGARGSPGADADVGAAVPNELDRPRHATSRHVPTGCASRRPLRMLFRLAKVFNDHRFERAAEDCWHLGLVTPDDRRRLPGRRPPAGQDRCDPVRELAGEDDAARADRARAGSSSTSSMPSGAPACPSPSASTR